MTHQVTLSSISLDEIITHALRTAEEDDRITSLQATLHDSIDNDKLVRTLRERGIDNVHCNMMTFDTGELILMVTGHKNVCAVLQDMQRGVLDEYIVHDAHDLHLYLRMS